ncbi:MAG TPA: hypothetical protein VF181_06675 [Balneolaceae bacterium]
MALQKDAKDLLSILCSSFYISLYPDQELSISELAVDLHKLQGLYQDELDKALEEFDGYSTDDIEKAQFLNRQNRLRKKLENLTDEFKRNAPKPIKKPKAESDKPGYEIDEGINSKTENPFIKKWYSRISSLGGDSCYKFNEDDLISAQKELEEISRYKIKLDAMKQVAEEASLQGSYAFYKDFKKVSDACNYYARELGEGLSRKLLKEKIRRYGRITENGEEITDWSVINKRINSWTEYEGNRYNKEEIPKE